MNISNLNLMTSAANTLNQLRYASNIASQNINNADNPNYSRNISIFENSISGEVKVSPKRMNNFFLNEQLNDSRSSLEYSKTLASLAKSVDEIVTGVTPNSSGDSSNALSQGLSDIIKAVTSMTSDDTFSARSTFLARIDSLLSVSSTTRAHFADYQNQINSEVTNGVKALNDYSKQLAKLNGKLQATPGDSQLLNQRDSIISAMSEIAKVRVNEAADGTVEVRIGAGYNLVSGRRASELEVKQGEFRDEVELYLNGDKLKEDSIGGNIGANLKARESIIRDSERGLAKVIVGYLGALNAANQGGYLSDGTQGKPLVDIPSVKSLSSSKNAGDGVVVASLDTAKIGELVSDPLVITKTVTGFEVKNKGTGETVNLTNFPAEVFGFKLEMNGSMAVGDKLVVDALPQMLESSKLVARENDIAAAGSLPYSSGDKSNLQKLGEVSDARLFNGGKDTVTNELSNAFVKIGNNDVVASNSLVTATSINRTANDRWSNLSGVNTQEEEINLTQYQQVYQAVAKIIQADKAMFKSMIDVI